MFKKLSYLVAAILLSIGMIDNSTAQVNTPSGAAWPFGSKIQQSASPYPYGLIPSNLPTGAYTPASNLYGKSQDAYLAYVEWKACYAYSCGGSPVQYRIRFDDASNTVSEGIGYGMLLAAYAADQPLFNGLYKYYQSRLNARGFMNWKINDGGASSCGTALLGTNGATDSEMDVAMALVVAACQWPAGGAAPYSYNYKTEAQNMIAKIRQYEIVGSSCGSLPQYLTSAGDGFISGCNNCFNPSYQSPGYTRLWQPFDAAAPANFWTTNVPNASYTLLNANRNTTTGLVSNWSDGAGTMNGCNPPANLDHGYDAGRNPWRMAVDYIWNGTATARTNFTQPLSTWIYTKTSNLTAANNLRGPVDLNGAYNGRTNGSPDAFFTSMWGAATIGVDNTGNNQSTLDFMYGRVKAVKQGNFGSDCSSSQSYYFGNTLRVITLFVMTGNFWKPCPPRCQAPAFTADTVSTCGTPGTVILNSGLSIGTGRTFQWFKNTVSQGAASSTANTLTVNATTPAPFGPGWFTVKVDTTGGCSQSDSIYVKSGAAAPNLGANKTLCSNTSITLNSGLYVTTGYSFTWDFSSSYVYGSLQIIAGETNSTLANVRKPGLYRVTATKAGCTSMMDTIRVSSSLISPQDNCIMPASGTVNLSITGPNLGPASQYDWYNVATAGSPLTGGTGTYTYTTGTLTSAGSPYTYYVQDKSRQYGSLGKPTPTGPLPADCNGGTAPDPFTLNNDGITAGWGVSAGNVYSQDWTVVRNINIDSVTVWFCLYNSTMPAVTFQLTDATGTTIKQTSAAMPGLKIVNVGGSYGPPYDGLFQGVRYYVGFTNVVPGTYRIKALAPAAGFNGLLEQHPTNVSYNYYDNIDGNTAYIKSTYGAFSPTPATFTNRYAHFYDWTISTQNNCGRIPVMAYVGGCPLGLPIELLSYEGKGYLGYNKLNWSTASEKNSDYFLIERAGDDGNYQSIGRVEASGNSTSIIDYSFIDRSAPATGAYYRLVEYDINGTKYISHSIYIGAYQSSQVSVFPNPANTSVTVRSEQPDSEFTSVEIVDIYGKALIVQSGNSSEKNIDISLLQSGIYFVRISFSETSEIIRLIKN